MHIKYI